MEAKATLSNYRQAPRKVRLVANLLKGKSVADALLHAKTLDKRAAPVMHKLIQSAVANAKSLGMDTESLRVKEMRVDKGVVLKRSMPRAFGRAFPVHKHSSHIMIVLSEKATSKVSAKTEEGVKANKDSTKKTTTAAKKVVAKKTTKTTK